MAIRSEFNIQNSPFNIIMKHTVMFRLKGTAAERQELARRFADALMELPALIPELKSMETGLNVNPGETFDVILTAEADSLQDIAVYSAHPAHVACVDIIRDSIDCRACVDYLG